VQNSQWCEGKLAKSLRRDLISASQRRDADASRDIVREYALEALGDEDTVLVIDETDFGRVEIA